MTRYIVDNLPNQSISGQLRIDGGLTVTDGTYSIGRYRALLTQTATSSANSLGGVFGYGLIVGETYTITDYVEGDDFSNVAQILYPGTINATGSIFVATGETPAFWSNLSTIESSGNLIVNVLENTLGYDIEWIHPFPGTYLAVPAIIGSKYGNFPRRDTQVICQKTLNDVPFYMDGIEFYSHPGSFEGKDDVAALYAWNHVDSSPADSKLYYTPVEITMRQNLDTTPVTILGSVEASYPFSYAAIVLQYGTQSGPVTDLEYFYTDGTEIAGLGELVSHLNAYPETSFLGTFSEDGAGGIQLAMPANLVERFRLYGDLTFAVFQD